VAELASQGVADGNQRPCNGNQRPPTATPFFKRGFYGKPIGMWGPNPNRNPNYGGP